MELPVNKFKHALKAGQPQIGMWSSLSSHIVAEILSNSGIDWVLLDTEHSPNELPMVQQQLHAMQGGTASPVVRVAWNDMVMVKRTLDMGYLFVAVGADVGMLARGSEALAAKFKG